MAVQPSHTRLLYGLIRDGRLAEAVERLQGVLRMAPGSRTALSLLAHCYYRQEDYEAAAQTYEALTTRCPGVPEYRLYWAQSLAKAGQWGEAKRVAASVEGFHQEVRLLQCAIKYEAGDLRGCRAALEALPPGGPAAAATAGCLAYKEGRWAEAAARFGEAMQMVGFSPDLAYALAACRYRGGDLSGAAAALADVVQAGVQLHPELGIGTQTEGMEARSVGNSAKLKSTALVEAFNLRAAIELAMGNPAGATAALSDMPPRAEHELDPVTLHNQALVSLALAAAGGGAGTSGSGSDPMSGGDAFAKLVHLLEHPPFPPELAGNLLSLCCRPDGLPGGSGPGPADRAAVAARLLAEHLPMVEGAVPGELLPLYEACVARATSAEEAAARLDALAGTHIEGLRRRVKAVQDARWAGDAAGAAAGLQVYEEALDAYVPVLMSLVQLHWEAGAYGRAQEALQQSAEFCSDHPAWRLNLAHALVAQEGGRLGEAAELYESILRHFAGGAPPPAGDAAGGSPVAAALGAGSAAGGSLLDVPPSAVANLCVCYVMGSQNEAAEELLRRLEDETTAAEAGAAGTAGAAAVPPHLCLANLAIGTLYCAKGNFEFGITRVMRALEPLGGCLDAPRWHAVLLCLLAMMDQVAKNMLVLKDALVADLLSFLEDVESTGRGMAALGAAAPSGGGASQQGLQTVAGQARAVRALLTKMHD